MRFLLITIFWLKAQKTKARKSSIYTLLSKFWLGRKDSNLRMPESKSGALTSLATPQLLNQRNFLKDADLTLLLQTHRIQLVFCLICFRQFLRLALLKKPKHQNHSFLHRQIV